MHYIKMRRFDGTCDAGPYFYLPKMQSHKEARLWNDVFIEAQDMLNIPRGTIKVHSCCLLMQ